MRTLSFLSCVLISVAGCTTDNPGAEEDLGDVDMSEPPMACGNGVIDDGEDCDDANGFNGDGCDTGCRFSCISNERCDDKETCNGAETCNLPTHTCKGGTTPADGTACGTGKACKGGACVDTSCGDMVVTSGEECDDGNLMNGDGCDACKFSCVSTDNTRNCTPADSCAGPSTCNDTTHTCAPRTPIADGLACPGNADPKTYCTAGGCKMSVCNNGMLERGETCDDGDMNETNGCRTTCAYSCAVAATDCAGAPPACQMWSCTAQHTCMAVANAALNGTNCGGSNICNNGSCAPPGSVCGNGTVESGEACDLGIANNTAANGCVACQFACTIAPNSCDDGVICNGTEACTAGTFSGQAVRRCVTTATPNGTGCGGMNICVAGVCKASTCGDGYTDARPAFAEECDPPAGVTCDANCKTVVCGNNRRETVEQCDDGNTTNLDACDSVCKFEQDHRVNWLRMAFNFDMADSMYCPARQLNSAIASAAQGTINDSLTTGVNDGSTSILFKLLGLDDLTGVADANGFTLGLLSGSPTSNAPPYSGANDLDWWYTPGATTIDPMRNPNAQLAATLSGRQINTSPSNVTINLVLGGQPASLRMTNAKVRVNVGTTVNAPTVSSNMMTPGHVAAEHLNPALQSFTITGQQTDAGAGKLCGNVAAQSLAQVPIPMALVNMCNEGYTAANSLLDALIDGCRTTVVIFTVDVIVPRQPDQNDPTLPNVGAGPPYFLSSTGANRVVNTCRSGSANGPVVDLTMCLADAAYSSYFKFTTDRVIIK